MSKRHRPEEHLGRRRPVDQERVDEQAGWDETVVRYQRVAHAAEPDPAQRHRDALWVAYWYLWTPPDKR